MVFSSLYFLFLYLPIVLFLYYITPLKWRNLLLLLVNLVFYAWGEPVYILIMFLSIGIDYTQEQIVGSLEQIGASVEVTEGSYQVTVPSWRTDLGLSLIHI